MFGANVGEICTIFGANVGQICKKNNMKRTNCLMWQENAVIKRRDDELTEI